VGITNGTKASGDYLGLSHFVLHNILPCRCLHFYQNSVTLCPRFNLKAFERELLYVIWPYRGSFIICPGLYDPIYSPSNSSCVKLYLYSAVRQYGSFGQQFISMKSISSSLCLTSVYEAWSWLLDVWSLLLFSTWRITTMKVVFGNSGTLALAFLATHSHKSVTVSCCVAFPSSSPPKPHLHISS